MSQHLMITVSHADTVVELMSQRLKFDSLPDAVKQAWGYRAAVKAIDLEKPDAARALAVATEENVAEIVTEIARANVVHAEVVKVTHEAKEYADRLLIGAVTAGAEEIIVSLKPAFEKAAAQFEKAWRQLPDGYQDAGTLIAAGSKAVANFETATIHAATLNDLRTIRDNLARLGAVASGNRTHEQGTRYADVADTLGAEQVAEAMRTRGPIDPWGSILSCGPKVTGLVWRTTWGHSSYLAKLPQVEMRHVRTGLGTYTPMEVAVR